ncbi:GGDEF domain-containing protein [Carnobacterium gallinarum]|uniref:GGDEF domain-containing protein n=1 Tax=Carnobacterium gallinarum TaxID=2749 RepID=UPI000552097E|nr:GGDEF domain-containing protein [Carnobacterium gallinarum]
MLVFEIIEPYITGITSILGIFFIQAVWLSVSRVIAENRLSDKQLLYFMEIGSGLLMTMSSIYLTLMSAVDHYYYLYGNLRLIIILIPAIFISARVSMISVVLSGIFRLFYFGITPVTIMYVLVFVVFLMMIIIAKKLSNGNNLRTLIFSFLAAIPIWIFIYSSNLDGTHIFAFNYMLEDYLNFIVIGSITYLSATYLYHLNTIFFKTVTDSLTDELTKARNFKDFNLTYLAEFEEAKAQGEPLNLALFDIDHFKTVNDTYGHLAGNYVLVELTDVLRRMESLNYGNVLFRTGGEEFALLLQGRSSTESMEILEEVRENVEKHFFYYESKQINITISIGLATYLVTDSDVKELYVRADEALYRSKENGRNRVSQ